MHSLQCALVNPDRRPPAQERSAGQQHDPGHV